MPDETSPLDRLNEAELTSIRQSEAHYGELVQKSAAVFGETAGMEPAQIRKLVGFVAVKLEEFHVPFDIRRDVIMPLFNEATATIGERAMFRTVQALPSEGEQVQSSLLADEKKDGNSQLTPELMVFDRHRVYWLTKVFGENGVNKIEALSPADRMTFLDMLHEHYVHLDIGATKTHKVMRARQLRQFLCGQTLTQIAAEYGVSAHSITQSLGSMADALTRQTGKEQLSQLISAANNTPLPEESSEILGLNRLQRNWLGRIFTDKSAQDTIASFDLEQRQILAERLGNNLTSIIRPRKGYTEEDTDRRRQEITLLLQGQTKAQIAETIGIGEERVRHELKHSASRLSSLSKEVRDAILKDSQAGSEEYKN